MFAVVKIGGNQYKVTSGDKVVVQRLSGNVGDKVSFPALMVADGTEVKLGKEAAQVPVYATIMAHDKGEKIHVRRFRAKSRSRRHVGFRAHLTTLTIAGIGEEKPVVVKAAPVESKKSPRPEKVKSSKTSV